MDSSWWSSMELLEQVYWFIAIPSTLIFLVLIVLTFIGGDGSEIEGVDETIDGDEGIGFQFFTIKNLVGFFTLFSWSGIACINGGLGVALTIFVSFLCGLTMMFIMALIFYSMSKLTDSGTLIMKNAIGGIGEVYLPVKAKRDGFGKIQINIQGGLRTLQALTDDDEELKVGTVVTVVDVINDQILIVTKHLK